MNTNLRIEINEKRKNQINGENDSYISNDSYFVAKNYE